MTTKEQVHSDYLAFLNQIHGNKRSLPFNRKAIVIGSDRKENIGATIVLALKAVGQPFLCIIEPTIDELDVRSPEQVQDYMFRHSDFDTLILSHGVTELDWYEDVKFSTMQNIFNINLLGTAWAIKCFVNFTLARPYRKKIVVIGSMAYKNVLNASAVYCASKAGVSHLVRCLGWELTPKAFDIFCVHPSNVEGTPMTDHTIEEIMKYRNLTSIEEAEDYWGSINLMPRWLNADDIADVVRWLVTDHAASYLSGQQIDLAGGQR